MAYFQQHVIAEGENPASSSYMNAEFTYAYNAINTVDGKVDAHIADTTDAHDASAISNTPSGNLASETVQGALNELQGDLDTLNGAAVKHSLAEAANDFLVASGAGAFVRKTVSQVKAILGYIGSLVEDTAPQLGGALACKNKAVYWDLYTITGATPEISVANGNKQKWTLTANSTPTFATPPGPTAWHIFVYQDASSAYTVTWPSGIRWANGMAPDHPVLSGLVVVCIAYDGTNYVGSWAKYSTAS